jgi:hypothetical protein
MTALHRITPNRGAVYILAVATMIALLLVSGGLAQEANQTSRIAAIAGCYAIELGPWLPDMGQNRSNDGIFLIPPDEITLTTTSHGDRSTHYVVRPALRVTPSVHKVMLWSATPPDTVEVIFSNGFSGFTVSVVPRGDILVGQAVSFWDFPRPSQKASAVLRRMSCHE